MQRLPAQSFQDLIVWQKAHQFVLGVYRVSKGSFRLGRPIGRSEQVTLSLFGSDSNSCLLTSEF